VGETRREPPERDHLLVVQLARRELPRPIEHPMDEGRRELVTLPGEGAHVLAGHDEDLHGLLDDRPARRRDEAGIRKQARDVALPPFRELLRTGAAIDEEGDAARQNDEEALHGHALLRERASRFQPPERPVRGQPLELLARRNADDPVFREPIDEIGCSHEVDTKAGILHPALPGAEAAGDAGHPWQSMRFQHPGSATK
jgi:hypothetical protein